MPRKDLTDITMVIDRSGSRGENIEHKNAAERGINEFVASQKTAEGEARLTLVEFDDRYDFVHKAINVKEAPPYTLVPRGWTALRDAVGKAMTETGERLAKMDEKDRPANVVFVVDTDGLENKSKEYTHAQIKEMIERQQKDYNWHFVFLGANLEAFAQGGEMGVMMANAAQYAPVKANQAYNMVGSKLKAMRGASGQGLEIKSSAMNFSPQEREELKDTKK